MFTGGYKMEEVERVEQYISHIDVTDVGPLDAFPDSYNRDIWTLSSPDKTFEFIEPGLRARELMKYLTKGESVWSLSKGIKSYTWDDYRVIEGIECTFDKDELQLKVVTASSKRDKHQKRVNKVSSKLAELGILKDTQCRVMVIQSC